MILRCNTYSTCIKQRALTVRLRRQLNESREKERSTVLSWELILEHSAWGSSWCVLGHSALCILFGLGSLADAPHFSTTLTCPLAHLHSHSDHFAITFSVQIPGGESDWYNLPRVVHLTQTLSWSQFLDRARASWELYLAWPTSVAVSQFKTT